MIHQITFWKKKQNVLSICVLYNNIWQLLETIEHYETSKIPGLVFIADFYINAWMTFILVNLLYNGLKLCKATPDVK